MPARCDPTTDGNVCVRVCALAYRSMAYLASAGRGNLISSSGWWNECVSHSSKMWFGGAFWESLFWIHFKANITFVVIQPSGTDSFIDTSFCGTCKIRAQKETYHPKCRISFYFRFGFLVLHGLTTVKKAIWPKLIRCFDAYMLLTQSEPNLHIFVDAFSFKCLTLNVNVSYFKRFSKWNHLKNDTELKLTQAAHIHSFIELLLLWSDFFPFESFERMGKCAEEKKKLKSSIATTQMNKPMQNKRIALSCFAMFIQFCVD